jgi:DNA-directed RNA polymerase specialized sigma24 family protein
VKTHSFWFREHDKDTHLRRQAMRGDPCAFAEIVRPMSPVLHGVIYQALGDAPAALEAFRTLVREAYAEREQRSAAVPVPMWLLRRAVAMAEQRASAVEEERKIAEEQDRYAGPEPRPAIAHTHADTVRRARATSPVGRAVNGLPVRLRMLLYLREIAKLLVQDLARVFDRAPHQVSAALFHTLETVRRFRDRAVIRALDPDADADAAETPFCTEVRERVALLRDGDIEEAGLDEHRKHFRTCPACLQFAARRTEVERELTGLYLSEQITEGEADSVLGGAVRPIGLERLRSHQMPGAAVRRLVTGPFRARRGGAGSDGPARGGPRP